MSPAAGKFAKIAAVYLAQVAMEKGWETAKIRLVEAREGEVEFELPGKTKLVVGPDPATKSPDRILLQITGVLGKSYSLPATVTEKGEVELHVKEAAGKGAMQIINDKELQDKLKAVVGSIMSKVKAAQPSTPPAPQPAKDEKEEPES